MSRLEKLHVLSSATREECLAHFDPTRVLGYCVGCPNYGSRWSCPPFPDRPLDRLGNWSHAVIAGRKVPLPPAEMPSRFENQKTWALERFHASRAEFRKILLEVETIIPVSIALVAGHCAQCAVCARVAGDPCRFPQEMRFSLEAIGFDVSSIAEAILGHPLQWPRQGLPEYFLTVGAMLCGHAEIEPIMQALDTRLSH